MILKLFKLTIKLNKYNNLAFCCQIIDKIIVYRIATKPVGFVASNIVFRMIALYGW